MGYSIDSTGNLLCLGNFTACRAPSRKKRGADQEKQLRFGAVIGVTLQEIAKGKLKCVGFHP